MAKVTIKDIAELAQVSKTAVSFAFNSPERLPASTVKRILDIAKSQGYTPNPVARSMSTGKTNVLGILVPQPISKIMCNPFYVEFIQGVGDICTRYGQSLMLIPPLRGSIQQAITSAVADGIIIIGLDSHNDVIQAFSQRDIPYLMVDSECESGITCVNIDDSVGAYKAMKHLLDLGHKRITILGILSDKEGEWKKYTGILRRRVMAYNKALKEAGLSIDSPEIDLIECEITQESGRAGFTKAWESDNRPTAVICMSDIIAIGALQGAYKLGVNVPTDISVIGFDNIPQSRWTTPQLTTVHQSILERGELAADLLNKLIAGEAINERYVLDTDLIVRSSTAQPRK
ncbi:MAG: LacI family DNA-binding transcriptional regulator [Spirochaetia bacterium]